MATWEEFKQIAAPIAREYDIPISVLLGQAALETGYGTSYNAQAKNNWFGLGAFDANPENSYRFSSPEESIRYYARLISSDPRYANAYAVRDDPFEMIREIKKAGYATDPDYVSKVVNIPDFQANLNDYYRARANKRVLGVQSPMPTKTPEKSVYDIWPDFDKYPKATQDYLLSVKGDIENRKVYSENQSKVKPLRSEKSTLNSIMDRLGFMSTVQGAETSAKPAINAVNSAYTVKPGDTLWGIAERTLGSGQRWQELKGYSGRPESLPIGTKITVPQAQPTRPVSQPMMSTNQGARPAAAGKQTFQTPAPRPVYQTPAPKQTYQSVQRAVSSTAPKKTSSKTTDIIQNALNTVKSWFSI